MKKDNILLILAVTAGMLTFTTSCWKQSCSECEIELGDTCINDSIKHRCPPGDHYAFYDYSDCICQCELGWTGATCEQRDTNFYIRFRHGTDTSALSELLSTSEYVLIDSPPFSYEGYFPVDNEIDTVRVTWLPFEAYGPYHSYPICETIPACTYLEMAFATGAIVRSITGSITQDTLSDIYNYPVFFGGTFKANLQISSSGQNYYLREGAFRLPFIL